MANKALKLVETQQNVSEQLTLTEMRETVEELFQNNVALKESLSNVTAMFAKEDQGWLKLGSRGAAERGLSLDDLKEWSEQIREAIAGNAHIKRGARLRISNVWDGGIQYSGLGSTETRGGGKNVQGKIDLPINQWYFFGNQAREERETCLFSDSIVFYVGDDKAKTLRALSIENITGEYRNPDNDAEIWAYRHAWNRFIPAENRTEPMVRWYFTDTFKHHAISTIKNSAGESEIVDRDKTLFDGSVNTQIGWAYGVPDALSALVWARLYKDFLLNGKIMSDAMATFAFKATTSTRTGAEGASMKMAQPNGAGSTAVLGATNDLVPMSSAGKSYDFDGGRALLAVVATAIEVSVIALSADPGTAGSSYGSASTLDLPTRLAIKSRRQWHIDFDLRVLRWMGAADAAATFDPMEDASDTFRRLQAVLLAWSSGLMHGDEVRKEILELLDIVGTKDAAPEGFMLPNNENSWARADVDPKENPDSTKPNETPAGQGKESPVGKTAKAQDLRRDGLGEMMTMLQAFIASEDALRSEQEK